MKSIIISILEEDNIISSFRKAFLELPSQNPEKSHE